MALRINTNVAALNAHKHLTSTDSKLSDSLAKLSSGLRINKAADDASGMVIADSLKAQALGLGQAIRNANDGVNIVQTADAALEESINIVNTIKTKAIQAAQDGQTTESRRAIQADITKLMEELDMIANTTSFNNQKLLSGNFTNKRFQVGAYSGETVNISVGSSQSGKIGHTMTSKLGLEGDKPGIVDISLYSNLQGKNFDVEAIEVAYDNTREHGMGAVSDAINKLSDSLGIAAKAFVNSTTKNNVFPGKTDSTFAINGIIIGEVAVITNDSTGALTSSINNKTAQHGVVASVDATGLLTLTSTDGRAIQVTSEAGTSEVLGNSDMSTVGYIQLNQTGANEIIVNNTTGGNVVALDSTLEIKSSGFSTADAIVAKGSVIATDSFIGAGWTTNQVLYGDKFNSDITTTEESLLTKGSVIASASTVAANGAIAAPMTTAAASTASIGEGTLLTGSTISSGSTLGEGSTIAANITIAGVTTVINETTTPTAGDSTVVSGSVLTAGTVLGTNTLLSMPSVTISKTDITTGESTIISGSTLGAGTVLSAGTVLASGTAVLQQTGDTTSDSIIAAGSTLAKGTILGAGTVITSGNGSGAIVQLSEKTTGVSAIASGSILATGGIIAQGTIIQSGLLGNTEFDNFVTSLGLDSGQALTEDYVLTSDITLDLQNLGSNNTTTLAAGSTIGNGSVLLSGTNASVDLTLSSDFSVSGTLTTSANSSFATNTSLLSGSIIQTDITLKTGMTISEGIMTTKIGSSFGDNTTLLGASQIAADITFASTSTTSGDITAKTGTVFGDTTMLEGGSSVATDVTLKAASTLSGTMASIIGDMTLGAGTVFNTGSEIKDGSSLYVTFEIANSVALKNDMSFGTGSIFKNKSATKFNAGSQVGGDAQLKSTLSVREDMTIGVGSRFQNGTYLTNGSTLGANTIITNDEIVADGSEMELAKDTILKPGCVITAGTYLTNDIVTTDGVFKAGNELQKNITTQGENTLRYPMTVKAGSEIRSGSTLGMNAADSDAANTQVTDATNSRLADLNVLDQDSAQSAISIAGAALQDLDKIRASLGSVQNQLTSTISNITTTQVNIMASESSIRDVDFAAESSNFTKLQILAQAGTFALSQANASSENVMSLLQ